MGLKQKTVSGVIWTSAGTLGNGIISFAVTIILARILLPYHFALIALLNIFLQISNVLINSGFSQAIIRDDNPSQTDLSSVFYFNIILSFIIYLSLFFAAPYISKYFDAPELTLLSRVIFLVILFNSFSIIQNATLNRSLSFAILNKSSLSGSLIAGLIAVIMAFTGFGIWSLVANMVLLPFFRSVFLWFNSKWRPINRFSFLSIKKYFVFGGFLMVQGIIDAISTNLASLIIGKVYTKTDLGYFSQGKKLDSYLVTPFTTIVQKVSYPILSKIKNEKERLKSGYRKIIGIVMFAYIPFTLFTIVTSDNMIISLFGENWIGAGVHLKIAAIGSILFPLQLICTNIIMIRGKTKMLLYFALLKQGIRIILLAAFINQGVVTLAIVFAVSILIGSLLYIILGMKYLGYTILELYLDLNKTLLSTIIGISCVVLIGYLINDLNIIILFTIQALTMVFAYTLSSIVINNEFLKEALLISRSIIPIKKK